MFYFSHFYKGLRRTDSKFIQNVSRYDFTSFSKEELSHILFESVKEPEFLPKAYGVIKEIVYRVKGLKLFDSQILAALAMQKERISELPTGEGKTLSAVLTATILALQGKKVHILVFNDYLAKRDYRDNIGIYRYSGLSVGYIDESMDPSERKKAYSCDVLYASAKQVAFDHLRSFLCHEKEEILCSDYDVAIVDEADSILIDEARIPLVLAGNAGFISTEAFQIANFVRSLRSEDYAVDKEQKLVWLTEGGILKLEQTLHIADLFTIENANTLATVNATLEARFLLEKDRDYLIKDGEIRIIDENTGRVAENRRFTDLTHQALEIYELEKTGEPTEIYNSMSMQSFLSLYKSLCGMTGTAASSASEFWNMYGLKVDVISPHNPSIRRDHSDEVFFLRKDHEEAILREIKKAHGKGQPILIGTQSVRESEELSKKLTIYSINHQVLNARNDEEEAEIIENAGMPFQVTISTNMAGRGVDIRLGGKNEEKAAFVRSVGGLYVISTGINRSVRIDNQLRGRAGRQGDPGESKFYILLETEKTEERPVNEFRETKAMSKLVRDWQKKQESSDVEARYMLGRYSLILEKHRKQLSEYRLSLLCKEDTRILFATEKPVLYERLISQHGAAAVSKAERQLMLHFLNKHWSFYLSAMEDKRRGIHLMVIGGKNPLDEYEAFAVMAYNEMLQDMRKEVMGFMEKCKITKDGINLEEEGLSGATTTWTYMIDESSDQFSRLPQMMRAMTNKIEGTVFSLHKIFKSK